MPTPDPNRTPLYLLDARGRRRSPAASKGHIRGRPPATKGRTFPPDPLAVEDFVALFDACTPQRPGTVGELSALRLRTLIVVLWRTGIRISEALALEERDLNPREGSIAHGMRHSAAVDWHREGLDLLTIQQQLGHAHLGVTQLYLRGIATEEVLAPIAARRPPMVEVA